VVLFFPPPANYSSHEEAAATSTQHARIDWTTSKASPGGADEAMMARTKSFQDLVHGQAKTDKKFAEALLREGIDAMLGGDMETGKTILRDYIKATVGFEKLGEATGAPPKSLIRMFGPRGNPQARNLFNVIGYLQKRAGLQLHVTG
jgi:DNA-binding phage protein